MAKKMKLDTTRLKQFALDKGERVGLGVAVAVMFVFAGYGIFSGMTASSPAETLKKKTADLSALVAASRPLEDVVPEGAKNEVVGEWGQQARYEEFASAGSFFEAGAAGDTKRQNPTVLPVGEVLAGQLKNIQLNYVQGGVLTLDYNETKGTLATLKLLGAGGAGLPNAPPPAAGVAGADDFVKLIHPTRMVVVHATFPYQNQLEVIRKALRLASVSELVAAQAAPRFLGMNIYRREILPSGEASSFKPLFEVDEKTGHPVAIEPKTKALLTTAVYDKTNTDRVAAYLLPGLATPLPEFMNASYPKPVLTGIEVKDEEGDVPARPTDPTKPPPARGPGPRLPGFRPQLPGTRPLGGGAANDDQTPTMTGGGPLLISKLPEKNMQDLLDKLKADFNLFDPNGHPFPEEGDDAKGPPLAVVPTMSRAPKQGPGPGKGPLPAAASDGDKILEKILMRFFDADVQPGKTYQYGIEVRMANPNFGKKSDVAFASLADYKELLSPLTITPPISIPTEYFAYAVDLGPKQLESKAYGPNGTSREPVSTERTAIQIHCWTDRVGEDIVADWVIAERLLFHRGEPLGRTGVEVELPVWNRFRGTGGQFELASSGGSTRGKAGKSFRQITPVDFPRDRSALSVLVDFEGGKRVYDPAGGRIHDDAATELLIVQPDGKLVVKTSREDADSQSEIGAERTKRYEAWRSRISSLRPSNTQGNAPMLPK